MTSNKRYERLMGFDARMPLSYRDPQWTEERKEQFLFRKDVDVPLSTDTMVWARAPQRERAPDVWREHEYFQFTWSDLAALKEFISQRGDEACAYIVITLMATRVLGEIKANYDPANPDWNREAILISEADSPVTPSELDDSWRFLGYDVSDNSLLSGLMNCGLDPELDDVPALRREWGPKLNDHHLFDNLNDSERFSTLSNERVKEHAPFLVFGLWHMRD